jgi:hypothetical protein
MSLFSIRMSFAHYEDQHHYVYPGHVFGRLEGGVDQGAFVGPVLHTITMTLHAGTTRIAGQPKTQSQPM